MTENFVNVTEGSGKKLHTSNRTIGANDVHDEYTLPGEFDLPSYNVYSGTVSTATAASHLLQLMAGASLKVRIRYIRIEQVANATASTPTTIEIWRLSTAGTTPATTVTPRPFETTDVASGATGMTLPSVKGTESVAWRGLILPMRQTIAAAGSQVDGVFEWYQKLGQKPLIIAAGTANGIVIKNVAAVAGGSLMVNIEFVETSF